MTVVFESTDLEAIEAYLGHAYARMKLSTAAGHPRARIEHYGSASLSADRLAFGFAMDFAVAPLDTIALATIDSGTIPGYHTEHLTGSFGPGDTFVLTQPGRPVTGRLDQLIYGITTIDPRVLSQVASPEPHAKPQPIRLLGYRPISAVAAAQLRTVICYIRDDILANPAASTQPLVTGSAARLLAATVLDVFPSTASGDPGRQDRHDANPVTVRRAVAFIEENAHRDISPADIAAAAGVTIRAVQFGFRHHLGTTPRAYLRQRRLDRARQDLLDADPGHGDTVTAIAARWGFLQPGRFAVEYRKTYGQPPSHALRG